MKVSESLAAGLATGFIDCNLTSLEQYHPKLLVNDHKRGMKVLSTIIQELRHCEEFYFSIAFITNSGVTSLINSLDELQNKGNVRGKIVTSQYLYFTEPTALKRLLAFPNIELKIATEDNLHAKGYIFKRKDDYSFIIGSSNLTQQALSSNKEWNIKLSSLEDGLVMQNILKEFEQSFEQATWVDEAWIDEYSKLYWETKQPEQSQVIPFKTINPNKMQVEALRALELLHHDGKKRALLISATGTGKTYLSAFDAKKENPRELLFIIHRENIARAAMQSYQKIFGKTKTMGLLTGHHKDLEKDFLFATVQTLSKEHVLNSFSKDYFDYMIIDEVHRAGSPTYQRILNYFQPEFLLGMSATPERTDGYDIFRHFDYNIAYEIRLHQALEEDMLVPFHYFGVSEIEIDGTVIDDSTGFQLLSREERVGHIIEKANFYGWDHGRVKGLVFCSRIEEARDLSKAFHDRGYETEYLDGASSEEEREIAINRLEQEDLQGRLDYIFSVDIFNEGVDIPSVNQVIMLRPTQSAIIFVQQLGRGLRKRLGKEYLTVIDFIGNYANNYMIPIALYGDRSHNKDALRKMINNESSILPGCSTVNFDFISKDRIFKSLDTAKIDRRADLKKDYDLLKFELGKVPTMMDFLKHGRREPYAFVKRPYGSYYNFLKTIHESDVEKLSAKQEQLLTFYSLEILNGKRVEEGVLLALLLAKGVVLQLELTGVIEEKFQYRPTEQTIRSAVRNLNGEFQKDADRQKYEITTNILFEEERVQMDPAYRRVLLEPDLHHYLDDQIRYSFARFEQDYSKERFRQGFILYQKYGRKDVCRILNWDKNEESTMYGYRIKNNTCPIFVTYNKEEGISESIKYEEGFINIHQFSWMTRNRVTLNSNEVMEIQDYQRSGLRIPLFVKKSDDEGKDFYYIGDVSPFEFIQGQIRSNTKNERLPIVNVLFNLDDPVEESLYSYIIRKGGYHV